MVRLSRRFRIFVLKQELRPRTIVEVPGSGTGESSNSLNDRTAVRIDAAIQAALAIAGPSGNFDAPTPTETLGAVSRGRDESERNVTTCRDFARHLEGCSGALPASGSDGTSCKSSAVTTGSSKATTEARLGAAINAALSIHATDRTSSSSHSALERSPFGGDDRASLARAAPRGGGRGTEMLTGYRPPAPPCIRDDHSASRERSGSDSYGDTSGGSGGSGYMQLHDSRPAPPRGREFRSGIGVTAAVNQVVQALASARVAEAHQATAAAARLQRLKEQQMSRRRKQREQGSSGERSHRPRKSEAVVALERREDHPRRITGAKPRGQARAHAENWARAEVSSRERAFQDEEAFVGVYRAPAATEVGRQAAACGSRAVTKAVEGTPGRNVAFVPTVAHDRFLPETGIGGARRAGMGTGESRRQPWSDLDG